MTVTAAEPGTTKRSGRLARWVLIVWTVGIWGSRARNIIEDDEAMFAEQLRSFLVAGVLIALAVGLAVTMVRKSTWHFPVLSLLIAGGVFRFGVRGTQILLDPQWDVGFKVVHTVLWAVTVLLSALAAREYWKASGASSIRELLA